MAKQPVLGAVSWLCSLLQTAGSTCWSRHQAPEICLFPAPHSMTPRWERESATVRNQQMPHTCKVYQPGRFFSREAVVKLFFSTPAAAGRAQVYSAPVLKEPHPLWLAVLRTQGRSSGEVNQEDRERWIADCRSQPLLRTGAAASTYIYGSEQVLRLSSESTGQRNTIHLQGSCAQRRSK